METNCSTNSCIEIQRMNLIKQGLKENIDFRIVYYNQSKEIKFIKIKNNK